MGWFSKILHKISRGIYGRRHDRKIDYRSLSQDLRPENEVGSVASSLLDGGQNGRYFIDIEPQLKEEEQLLTRSLQEKLNSQPLYDNGSSIGRDGNGNFFPPMSSSSSTNFRARICAGCNTQINQGSSSLIFTNTAWHVHCFKCHECDQLISNHQYSMSGSFPYHKACYEEHFYPKCQVCKEFIPTNAEGFVAYATHPFWSQKYCPSHEHDGTHRCFSCRRLIELLGEKYVAFEDGRKVCLECVESAIMDNNECQPLYLELQEFYKSLDMKIEQQFPVLLVDLKVMNQAMYGEKRGNDGTYDIIRGLCLSEGKTVDMIHKKVEAENRAVNKTTKPRELASDFNVTAILLLNGLPRLLAGSILAHEMMHAWFRLNGYGDLPEYVSEGMCQVLAYKWLESRIIFESGFRKKLREFYMNEIETHTSPVYGDGFRAGNKAVLNHGLYNTLQYIRVSRKFPN